MRSRSRRRSRAWMRPTGAGQMDERARCSSASLIRCAEQEQWLVGMNCAIGGYCRKGLLPPVSALTSPSSSCARFGKDDRRRRQRACWQLARATATHSQRDANGEHVRRQRPPAATKSGPPMGRPAGTLSALIIDHVRGFAVRSAAVSNQRPCRRRANGAGRHYYFTLRMAALMSSGRHLGRPTRAIASDLARNR
jgi:hypothetical protein